jgi:uncharacterized membrane protein
MKSNVALVAIAALVILLLLIWLVGFWKLVWILIVTVLASAAVAFFVSKADGPVR